MLKPIAALAGAAMSTATPALAQTVASATSGTALNATLPADLSFTGMILNADWVVRGVIAGLAFASVVTWTVLLAKGWELTVTARRIRAGLAVLQAAGTLEDAAARLAGTLGTCRHMVDAARTELLALPGAEAPGVKERAGWQLERLQAAAGRAMGRATGVLATIAATGPFVGLFGTVWGIMNSFIGISRAQTTNLAVVAPGIAEALLATAVGLVAAIPAVIAYNALARVTTALRARLGDATAEVMRLLSRDLDRAAAPTVRI